MTMKSGTNASILLMFSQISVHWHDLEATKPNWNDCDKSLNAEKSKLLTFLYTHENFRGIWSNAFFVCFFNPSRGSGRTRFEFP